MVKLITALAALTAAIPSAGFKEATKAPLAGDGAVIVKLMPHRIERADGDYVVDGDKKSVTERYDEMKKALDERFESMFELKKELDRQQSEISAKWDEYYALHEKYNRELKKIIAAWVTESNYVDGDEVDIPTPPSRNYKRA